MTSTGRSPQYAGRAAVIAVMLMLNMALIGCSEESDLARPIYLSSPAAPGSAEPHLAALSDGSAVLSWLEPDGEAVRLRHATYADAGWSQARTVARGSNWFVNWADFPSVEPITQDLWAAHWLTKRPGGPYAYDVSVALSKDAGQSWGKAITPHRDDTATEHGFVSLYRHQGRVAVVWLDGRNTLGHQHGNHPGTSAGMTLRSAVISDAGVPEAAVEIDSLVCDCCQTDVASTSAGPVLVYRDRTVDETRDISVARQTHGRWSPGEPVARDGWKISGCPVNGPAVAADDNAVAVAWFTDAGGQARVRFAHSEDAAGTFAAAVDIDGNDPIGRVDVTLLNQRSAAVSWLRKAAGDAAELVVRSVSRDGDRGPVVVVARTEASRVSGFPQMLRVGAHLLFAWTQVSSNHTRVETALIPLNLLQSAYPFADPHSATQ